MKRFVILMSMVPLLPAILPLECVGQEQPKTCQFDISGTWQSSTNGQLNPTRARFGPGGVMTDLSPAGSDGKSGWRATSKSTFKLDNPKAPKTLTLTALDPSGQPGADTTLQITTFDNGLFATAPEGATGTASTRWTRIDPQRYFVILAAGKGDPGFGAAGFAMLIKTDGVHTQNNAYGVYPVDNPLERHPILGVIPSKVRQQFDHEPMGDSGSMLRLEVTAGPYYRALEVLQTWERRSEENTLLYTTPYLNNAVYLNQLVSSLNDTGVLTWQGGKPCTETIKLQRLTWLLDDSIMTKHNLTQTPYYLFKALREKNDSLHLNDSQFHLALAGNRSNAIIISSR